MTQAGGEVLESAARPLALADAEISAAIEWEAGRRASQISLIPAENHPSRAVREAESSILADSWVEGLPGSRTAAAAADAVEEVARRRLRALLQADHANVQPHSGTLAVLAAYGALAAAGATILAPDPAHGAAHVHGGPLSVAARLYRFVHYAPDRETGRVDLDEMEALARRCRPAVVVAGGAAWPEVPDYAGLAAVASGAGARLLVDAGHVAGLVAAGLHPNPVAVADAVAICTRRTLRGPRGGAVLCRSEHARAVDRAVWPGLQAAPDVAAVAAKAVCFQEAGQEPFRLYQRSVLENAAALAGALSAGGLRLFGSGAGTHLVLADLRGLGLAGRSAERACEQAGVLAQRAAVPFDPLPPPRCSGLRMGTAAVTSRGMGPPEMREIAEIVLAVLRALAAGRGGEGGVPVPGALAGRAAALAAGFPIPCR